MCSAESFRVKSWHKIKTLFLATDSCIIFLTAALGNSKIEKSCTVISQIQAVKAHMPSIILHKTPLMLEVDDAAHYLVFCF